MQILPAANTGMLVLVPSLPQGLQLQSTFTSTNGSTALIAVNNHSPPSPASLLDSIGSAITNHSLVLSQGHSLQAGAGLTQHSAATSAFGTPPGSDQSVVTMGQLVAVGGVDDSRSLEGGVHQILLGDVQTIPVRIVDSHPALSKLQSSQFYINIEDMVDFVLCVLKKGEKCVNNGELQHRLLSADPN